MVWKDNLRSAERRPSAEHSRLLPRFASTRESETAALISPPSSAEHRASKTLVTLQLFVNKRLDNRCFENIWMQIVILQGLFVTPNNTILS